MKNTYSHNCRQERRNIERKKARKARRATRELTTGLANLSLRRLYKDTWCEATVAYAGILRALVELMREVQPNTTDFGIYSVLAANHMPLPIPYSIQRIRQFVNEYLSPTTSGQYFTSFINEGYFQSFQIDQEPALGGCVRAVCAATRGADFIKELDIGLIPTPEIDFLIPLAKGEITIDELWNEYLKSDPFGRFGI